MEKLFDKVDPITIILVLIIAIPSIVNFITWCKGIWQKREDFKQANIEQGKKIEKEAETQEHRLENGETRMTQLEADVKSLTETIDRLEKTLNLLTVSDQLDIKSWIKMQHEKWIPRQCIDSQTLDLLEQRFKIYEKEGGNSWAKKLVDELRALPVVTVVPIQDIHDNSSNR